MLKFEPEVSLVIEVWDGNILNLLFTHPPDADIVEDVNAIANSTGIESVAVSRVDPTGEEFAMEGEEDRAFGFLVAKCHNIKRIARELAVYFNEQHGLKVKTEDCRCDPEAQYERTSIYR